MKKPKPRGRKGGRKPLPADKRRVQIRTTVTLATAMAIRAKSAGKPIGRQLDADYKLSDDLAE